MLNNLIGNIIKIENFEVAENDFPCKMNFYEADSACRELGDRWRLPTIKMLSKINDTKKLLKNIKPEYYWSSSILNFNNYPIESAWAYNLNNTDKKYFFPLTSLQNVRAIKVTYFDFEITKIIGKPIIYENIEIAQYDFPEEMCWEDTIDFFLNLGSNWRLPDKYEITSLNDLFKGEIKSTINYSRTYWCTEIRKPEITSPVGFHFSNGLERPTYTYYSMTPEISNIYDRRRVRVVRSI